MIKKINALFRVQIIRRRDAPIHRGISHMQILNARLCEFGDAKHHVSTITNQFWMYKWIAGKRTAIPMKIINTTYGRQIKME